VRGNEPRCGTLVELQDRHLRAVHAFHALDLERRSFLVLLAEELERGRRLIEHVQIRVEIGADAVVAELLGPLAVLGRWILEERREPIVSLADRDGVDGEGVPKDRDRAATGAVEDDVRRYALRGIHLPARRIVLEVFLLRRNTRNLVGVLNEIVAGALQDVRERWSLLRLKACDGEANRCEDDRKASIGPCTHAEPFSS